MHNATQQKILIAWQNNQYPKKECNTPGMLISWIVFVKYSKNLYFLFFF